MLAPATPHCLPAAPGSQLPTAHIPSQEGNAALFSILSSCPSLYPEKYAVAMEPGLCQSCWLWWGGGSHSVLLLAITAVLVDMCRVCSEPPEQPELCFFSSFCWAAPTWARRWRTGSGRWGWPCDRAVTQRAFDSAIRWQWHLFHPAQLSVERGAHVLLCSCQGWAGLEVHFTGLWPVKQSSNWCLCTDACL